MRRQSDLVIKPDERAGSIRSIAGNGHISHTGSFSEVVFVLFIGISIQVWRGFLSRLGRIGEGSKNVPNPCGVRFKPIGLNYGSKAKAIPVRMVTI